LPSRWGNLPAWEQRSSHPPHWGRPGPERRGKGHWVVAGIIGALLLGACMSDQTATPSEVTTATLEPSSDSPVPSTTALSLSTVQKATIPKLVGMKTGQAKSTLSRRGLRWTITYKPTDRFSSGTVISQSKQAGTQVVPDTVITLVVAKAPPAPPPTTAPSNCDPAYPDVCLHVGVGDYDCSGGSGNGPNYVEGPVRVLPPDPFDLDGNDNDGLGCESG
jgi:PASTA domain